MSAAAQPREPGPTVEAILARETNEGAWAVPLELALACTSSVIGSVVTTRYADGQRVNRSAIVFARGDRFFAIVKFEGHPDLLMPLDCHTLQNKPGGGY